ncbi:aminotransferase class I/II-fold pyridoxal phosphate-dependent enzyme [Pontibacter silvestris]|uniref:Aminotransferase class I/II-fold pyridoxal phosphate-dependent enzyme n=1 Tax=Pontibacter silvestris TaxID=2305183 RepID=A0ABW4WXR2_9BACT|nr:aminotransferase class I/II-fold pyridoxal phosphate-dependent enzyme [Pontibacter silvestris]MCC9135343.1 aminotransferase class I/II-fold pyridoxal phosphate-dependent enzyme [Pontibacter silvestris]
MLVLNNIHTDELPGRTLSVEGVEYLFCSGTSYLGIARNEQFKQHLFEGFHRYGTNYSSSRNSNLHLRVFDEAEAYLAAYSGAEAALTMSSGFLAGQTLVRVLQASGHFIYAPGTHPAMWLNETSTTVTLDYDKWVKQLIVEAPTLPAEHIIIVCNSLDPLRARNYHFSWIDALPENKQITLIIDDSHGFGVTGANGAGIFSQLSDKLTDNVRLIVATSFGKAFGIPAGIILGDKELISQLRLSSNFGGASPAIPAYLYAFLHSEMVFKEAREKLLANITFFRQQLSCPALFNCIENFPVFYTQHESLCPYLLENQVLISSFRYPTPTDDAITRVILNSLHTKEDLQRLTELLNKFQA